MKRPLPALLPLAAALLCLPCVASQKVSIANQTGKDLVLKFDEATKAVKFKYEGSREETKLAQPNMVGLNVGQALTIEITPTGDLPPQFAILDQGKSVRFTYGGRLGSRCWSSTVDTKDITYAVSIKDDKVVLKPMH